MLDGIWRLREGRKKKIELPLVGDTDELCIPEAGRLAFTVWSHGDLGKR